MNWIERLAALVRGVWVKVHWKSWFLATLYVLAWLFGIVLLCMAWWLGYQPRSMRILGDLLPWLVIWSSMVVIIWIFLGDRSAIHKESFKPYRSIWVGFVLSVLTVFLVSYANYGRIKYESQGLRGAHVLDCLQKLVTEPSDTGVTPSSIPTITPGVIPQCDSLRSLSVAISDTKKLMLSPESSDRLTELTDKLRSMRSTAREIDQLTEYLWHFVPIQTGDSSPVAVSTPATSTIGTMPSPLPVSGVTIATSKAGLIAGREPLGVSHVTTDTVEIMGKTSKSISSAIVSMSNSITEAEEFNSDFDQLSVQVEFMTLLINAEQNRMAALDSDFVAPFINVTVLYAGLLLFPWILLLVFLLRKSEFLTSRKYEWLSSLDLLYSPQQERDTGVPNEPSMSRLTGCLLLQAEAGKDEHAQIREMTFRNSEYWISLGIFTAFGAVMWYLFFYPIAAAGLIQLTARGGGLNAFAEYLSGGWTPLMFGYLGAYLFLVLLMLRRYFAADLTPKVYVFADGRIIMVFVLGVVLQLIANYLEWSRVWVALVAFVVGVFPMEGLQWILQLIRTRTPSLNGPDVVDRSPLTKLDGINIWHEERLSEESVDNIQNLANASIGQLILHLNWSPVRLLDWVDQAVLFDHAKDLWYPAFVAVGIRTATALLDWQSRDNELVELAEAMKAAPVSARSGSGKESTPETMPSVDVLSNILRIMIVSISKTPNISTLVRFRALSGIQAES